MNLISSSTFIFLTNSEEVLPHKQTIERIINRKHINDNHQTSNFIFNYEEPISKIENDECLKFYNINNLYRTYISYGE